MNTTLNVTESNWTSYITLGFGQAVLKTTVENIKTLDITDLEDLSKIATVFAATTGISVLAAERISNNLFTLGQVSTGGKVMKLAKICLWSTALAVSSHISLATGRAIFTQL
ncbi:MAG: hypothetical protein LLF94_07760 [Chlamydiales bacterium]|nr:hypothetical protein [Chlamydiales bacterium]